MYRELFTCKGCFSMQTGLDTNLSSAFASLKFTRPDIRPNQLFNNCQFEYFLFGAIAKIKNVSRTLYLQMLFFLCKISLDTNINSALASLKFTRPATLPNQLFNNCQFECFLFGTIVENKKCIENPF